MATGHQCHVVFKLGQDRATGPGPFTWWWSPFQCRHLAQGLGGCHYILPGALGPGTQNVYEITFKALAFYSNCELNLPRRNGSSAALRQQRKQLLLNGRWIFLAEVV